MVNKPLLKDKVFYQGMLYEIAGSANISGKLEVLLKNVETGKFLEDWLLYDKLVKTERVSETN